MTDHTIRGVKITSLGLVLALKNLGTWLATMTLTSIREDPILFLWVFIIYALINVPTDLLLMNHASKKQEVT